jgi:hypothetical protein
MANYTIELSSVEEKALHYVALNANDWIQNAVHERCRLAIEELANDEIKRLFDAGIPISGTKDEIVLNSPLPTAQQRHDEMLAQIAAGIPGS